MTKRILSGITPSGDGNLHIGNYLGAVRQFIELSASHECFFMFADLHALTTVHSKEVLQKNIESLILNEIALVGDVPHVFFFRQSEIPMHTELTWVFNTLVSLGVLKRAHAYKDKLANHITDDDINLGLFTYPILMASDILLYKPDLVPVGKDQKQHVEITRDIADRFNKRYKTVFPLPEPLVSDDTAVILGTDGKRKMSKSLGNIISIFEDKEVIKKQVHKCFTDPYKKHLSDPGHIEGNMVFYYLRYFGEKRKVEEMEQRYQEGTLGDVEAKEYLFECIMKHFEHARYRYQELLEDQKRVKDILEKGTAKALEVAHATMGEVRDAIGLMTVYGMGYEKMKQIQNLNTNQQLSIEEFSRIQQRVGRVMSATYLKNSEKLIRLEVDFGDEQRIIFTGVRQFGYTIENFLGKQFFFLVNIQPKKIMGEESQGMILAVDGQDGKPVFLSADGIPLGAFIR